MRNVLICSKSPKYFFKFVSEFFKFLQGICTKFLQNFLEMFLFTYSFQGFLDLLQSLPKISLKFSWNFVVPKVPRRSSSAPKKISFHQKNNPPPSKTNLVAPLFCKFFVFFLSFRKYSQNLLRNFPIIYHRIFWVSYLRISSHFEIFFSKFL